jgi:hypothetical protein
MAKTTGPLLSFGADGQIGKSMVMSKWRGITYARRYVIPANPRTTAQQANRTRFAFLREMFKLAPAEVRAPWDAFCKGRPFLPFNKFVGENNRLLAAPPAATDLQKMIMSPGALGGLPPVSVSAATGSGSGEVDVTINVTNQLPPDWTVDSVAAAAVWDQDPVGIFTGPFVAGSEASPATPVTLSGLGAAEDCVAFGWVVYERNDGQLAYSVSLADTATSGA